MKRIIYTFIMIVCACSVMACGSRITSQNEQEQTEKEYKAISLNGPREITDEEKEAELQMKRKKQQKRLIG